MNERNKPRWGKYFRLLTLWPALLLVWILRQAWAACSLLVAHRDDIERGNDRSEKADQGQRPNVQEESRRRNRNALNRIYEEYDLEEGTRRACGSYVPIPDLLKVSSEVDELRHSLNTPIGDRPKSGMSEQDLWSALGGKGRDLEDALAHIFDVDDPECQQAAATVIIQVRRELDPSPSVDDHLKAASELAARLEVDRISGNRALRRHEGHFLRILERRARWYLIRTIRPKDQHLRRSSRPKGSAASR